VSEVLLLKHGGIIPAGHLRTVLAEAEIPVRVAALDEGDPIPPGDWRGVVSLGGAMSAYEEEAHPWLRDEKRFLAEMVEADVPVLGICLGAQTLADALGGRAYLAPGGPEIGMVAARLTPAGGADPAVRGLTAPIPTWHQDTFDLPPGATLLAESDRYPHAYRLGSALAVQSHPEATPYIVARWAASATGAAQLDDHGVDPDALLRSVRAGAEGTERAARILFGEWVGELLT